MARLALQAARGARPKFVLKQLMVIHGARANAERMDIHMRMQMLCVPLLPVLVLAN